MTNSTNDDRPGQPDAQDLPSISIVVIGRNEGERLIRCLDSIAAVDYPADRLELIYVDTNSTDGSCAAAEARGARVVPINPPRPSAAAARNAGLRAVRHDFVQLLDGDTILHPAWLRAAVDILADDRITCTFGRCDELNPDASPYMRVATLDWYVPPGPARYSGGCALHRRETLEHVGRFDESLIAGEEPELCYRIRRHGSVIWRSDQPMVQHDLNMTTFRQYWQRAVRSGWAYIVTAAKCRAGPEPLWRRENIANAAEVLVWLVAAGFAVVLWNLWILILLVVVPFLRTVWIASRVRLRTDTWNTALLYGLSCQFMRIPLFVGQIRGLWYLLRRREAKTA